MTGDHTITFRSLETDSSPPSNGSFVFDGTHSDIARQLFIRHQANDTRDRISLKFVPSALKTRLSTLNIDFDDLPGLVQRAVLWDTGFAIAPGNVPVQIWPMGGRTMANIAVKMHEVDGVDCDFTNCSQPNNVTAYYTRTCTGYQMGNTSHCVADVFEDKGARGYLGNMWARGGDPDVVPEIVMRDHTWTEDIAEFGGNTSFSVYVVHTIPSLKETPWSKCPKNGRYGTVSIPCVRRDHFTDAFMAANTTTPTGSVWVTTWLKDEFGRDESSDSVVIILIVLTVVALVGAGWFGYRRRAEFLAKRSGGHQPEEMRLTIVTSPSALHRSSISSPTYDSPGSSKTLKVLLGSVPLQGKRIPYDSLEFDRVMSKGASGEVWLCEYNGQKVAVKKLLQAKTQKAEEVQTFAEEIELSASLVHPNIIEFLGVAWNTLSNLAMVLEFLPMGNLQKYLENDGHNLSWARHKIHMAIGVAQALKYLHACTPPLIHRDIKSTNILLTESLEPKVIDFGISRGLVDRTMTGGVGTPYWTAPEILEGERYTEQSDIYSFGVLLSELDTGRIPYHDALMEDGTKMKPFKVLHEVMSGSLRPSFSDECPPRIQRISSACLSPDPQSRPTAQELVQELEGKDGDSEKYEGGFI
ncbi:hypothetical protein PR003_g19571 [Phytophthora rubi]|uniref:Protein kinase domain-containing protein n=1 Tax=Phytophthora rubi TaxID=129364 RepID=A0A6A3KAV8_9STRA|nr:hypothetical protein PR001_g18626 [Phytophthora rubi]KAE9313163.1 hypothetical protein PR003_g19571 [Phytophthora rubi]